MRTEARVRVVNQQGQPLAPCRLLRAWRLVQAGKAEWHPHETEPTLVLLRVVESEVPHDAR